MVKILLKEDERCVLNSENPNENICNLKSNTTRGGFNGENLNHYAQSRQTAEEFRSAAPPDCRVNVC